MKLESPGVAQVDMYEPAPRMSRTWTIAAALVLGVIVWLLGWYWNTAHAMVSIWDGSQTFAHGFLIVPISAWMVWHRRQELAQLTPHPNFLALLLLPLVGFGWLLGELAGVGVVQQYALVVMIPLLVWIILGNEVAWALAFPLFFLLFAVPFGEFLLPPLMEHTADFTVFALRATGIPVYREGLFFSIPSGNWSVVEACSGLRYLIASLTLGLLYAYLTYRSISRRVVFVAVSVIVPIVANWLRAYMIVMIGHLSSMKYAVGVDHLLYGWLFFGIVMLALFWIGSYWREDLTPQPAVSGSIAVAQRNGTSLTKIAAAAAAVAVVAAVWPLTASRFDDGSQYEPPALRAPPAAGGWQPVAGRLADWQPKFLTPWIEIKQDYATDSRRAGLYIGYYRNQRGGAKLITSLNTLVPSTDSPWANVGETQRNVTVDGQNTTAIATRLRGPSKQLLVWHWYWVDGQYTVNPYRAKLLQAKSKLFGDRGDGAVVIVYTSYDTTAEAAAATLREFVDAISPAITADLHNAR